MSRVVVQLADATEHNLREKAAQIGQTLEDYLRRLAERDAKEENGSAIGTIPSLPDDEFDRLLDELATGPTLPHLPNDFSRADIYPDHDQ